MIDQIAAVVMFVAAVVVPVLAVRRDLRADAIEAAMRRHPAGRRHDDYRMGARLGWSS